jgi:hypothetical protein
VDKNIKAWMYQFPMSDGKWGLSFEKPLFTEGVPLVHEREWVGLSAEDMETFEKNHGYEGLCAARTAEALLRGKNNG